MERLSRALCIEEREGLIQGGVFIVFQISILCNYNAVTPVIRQDMF